MTRRQTPRPQKPRRAVLDTNVVLSALVFGKGPAAQLRSAWQRGDFVPLVCTATVQELVRVLTYPKFQLDAQSQHELLADYPPHSVVVDLPDPLPAAPACRDPMDLPFLHLAVAGRADFLVTGDADLLVLAGKLRPRIVPPDAFLKTLLPATDLQG